ncbi:MAG: DUF2178 domain-containing protein [Patescibacteria group bacterium]
MKLTKKLFIYRILLVAIFAAIMGISINTKNYILSIIAFITLLLTSIIINTKLKKQPEATADERDWKIGGKSAFWTIRIFSIPAALLGFVFVMMKDEPLIQQNHLDIIGQTLSFSVCAILLSYSIIFRILRNKGE